MRSLSLKKSVIQQFWVQQDGRVANIMDMMESMEKAWIVDDDADVAMALEKLSERLNQISPKKLVRHEQQLVLLLSYMSTSRCMRILRWLDDSGKGQRDQTFTKLMEYAQQSQDDMVESEVLLNRLRTLKSVAILGQVFTANRSRSLTRILQET